MGRNEYQEIPELNFQNPSVIDRILQKLADHEEAFKTGNQSSLFAALCLCAQYQAVIPAWASDAILQGATDLASGDCKDFNSLFGWNSPSQKVRQLETMIKENSGTVLAKLFKHRAEGGSLNAEEAFGSVSDETGLSRRVVETIYKRHQQAVKSVPKGTGPAGAIYAAAFLTAPMLRRYDRRIL